MGENRKMSKDLFKHFDLIYNGINAPVCIVDGSLSFVYNNKSYCEAFGESDIKNNINFIFSDENIEKIKKALKSKTGVDCQEVILGNDYSMCVIPSVFNEEVFAVIIFSVKISQKIIEKMAEDDVVDFYKNAIGVPTAMIFNCCQLIENNKDDKQLVEKYVERIKANAYRTLRISGIIDETIKNRNEKASSFNNYFLNEYLEKVFKDVKIITAQKGVKYNLDFEATKNVVVSMDSDKIEKVICNIISNSIRFCKKIPEISVKTIENDDCVTFEICDNSIGIEKNALGYVGTKFYCTVACNGSKGLGLGINICKDIIFAHGGDFKIENYNGGVKVTFSIKKAPKDSQVLECPMEIDYGNAMSACKIYLSDI